MMLRLLSLLSLLGCSEASDQRCLLEGGGSTDTFFVREDSGVGEEVGRIRVNGNVGRDILLSLEEDGQSGPVSLDTEGGVARLVLVSSLDREQGGPRVTVTVVCERLGGRRGDVFTLPVTIHVTDVNDNAPVFVSGPQVLNVTEDTPLGTVLTEVVALDTDQQGPFSMVHYSVLPGPHSSYVRLENPLDGKVVLNKKLDFETDSKVEVVVRAEDKGSPALSSETNITIHVGDADDKNPAFLHDSYSSVLPSEGTKLLVLPSPLKAVDQDLGLNAPVFYSFRGEGPVYSYLQLNSKSGSVYVTGDAEEVIFLLPTTVVISATQYDNEDRVSLTTLTIQRGNVTLPKPALQFVDSKFSASILENFPVGNVVLNLGNNYNYDQRLVFSIKSGDLPNKEFRITRNGDLVLDKGLDFETQTLFTFSVVVTDGMTNDEAEVSIRVLNVNDWNPDFRYPEYEFFVSENRSVNGQIIGRVHVTDGDKDDRVSLDIRGEMANVFGISNDGDIIIKNIGYMRGQDSGVPPRTGSAPVRVRFEAERTPAIRYRSDAPKIFLMWVLSLILVILVIIIICLSLYICKSKRKFSPPSLLGHNDQVFLRQEFPHEKIAQYSSTMRRAKEGGPLVTKLRPSEEQPQVTSRPSSRSGEPVADETQVTTSNSIINVQPASSSEHVVFNPLNPRSGSKRYQRRAEGESRINNHNNDLNRSLRQRKSALKKSKYSGTGSQTLLKENLSKTLSATSDDINECGLPIPPPPPIPPPQHNQKTVLRSFSTGQFNKKGTDHFNIKYSNPRSSIRRSIRKLNWTDVNNNNSFEAMVTNPGQPQYAEETMKSSGESVYF